jgi:hypothetical protein
MFSFIDSVRVKADDHQIHAESVIIAKAFFDLI